MNFGFLKIMSQNAWLKDIQTAETDQELDTVLTGISSVVDRASLQWQINCRETLKKAIEYVNPGSEWNNLNEDMALRLLKLSSDFTTEKMQDIVAKIIPWEYNQPWRYSLKTLDVVRNLTKKDIELFQKFCWYVFDDKNFFADWYNLQSDDLEILRSIGIWYDEYLYLQDLWLVGNSRNFSQEFGDKNDSETVYEYSFSIQNITISLHKKWATTINWLWSLTKAWEELLTITWFQRNDILKDLIIKHFNKLGFE